MKSHYQQELSNQQYHQHSFASLTRFVTTLGQQRRHKHTISIVRVKHKHNCLLFRYMSNRPSDTHSPSNSPKSISTCTTTEATQTTISSTSNQDSTETPQSTTEQSFSTPTIVITGSPTSRTPTPDTSARKSRPLALRYHSGYTSSPQPTRPQASSSLHERPRRSQSEPFETRTTTANTAMSSSGSSPSGTSTAGSNSGSGQLPYAPFPYPMPANPRGSGQGK